MPFEGSGRAAASTTSPLKDGSRAIGSREPCQVGNQAALSGSAGVPRGRLSRGQILTYACGRCSILDVWPYYVSSRLVFYGKAVFFVYLALYRKWRPQTFSDVRGQDHITAVLLHGNRNLQSAQTLSTSLCAAGLDARAALPLNNSSDS